MRFAVVFLAALLCATALAAPIEDIFAQWKHVHGKSYASMEEELARKAIFAANKNLVDTHNAGASSYRLAVNSFADLTNAEFRRMYLAPVFDARNVSRSGSSFLVRQNVQVPASVDWRTKGVVTAIKNQGQCGSCWSFSTTGSLEGQHAIATGNLVSLSEQNLVDCSGAYGNMGCDGGLMDQAFEYIQANGGIDTEASYPYTAADGQCQYNPSNSGATCSGHVDVASGSEGDLQNAVATVGPVSIAIDASHDSFQFYSSGVYSEPDCSSTQLDHGVLAVGYGTDDGTAYWLVKNSWGTGWGMSGYIEMSRNAQNQCGVATMASYPLV